MPLEPELLRLSANHWVPNNPRLPVLLYRNAIAAGQGDVTAAAVEALFRRNGWPPQWRDGVYDYHHYHSTAHEVLGVVSGSARLMLGGPDGREISVHAGDALVLPVGTGHCRVAASTDFLVVGAYPADQEFDICRVAATPERLALIAGVPFPDSDPIEGAEGALPRLWPHR